MFTSINFLVQKTKKIAGCVTAVFFATQTLAQPFVTPIGGTPQLDWAITNYVDLDPPGSIRDYRGGNYTYETDDTHAPHDGIDITLANFAAMDAGVRVFAAAAGTVELVQDGNYDRCSRVNACGDFPNRIRIRHANNIATEYMHLRNGSINVIPGQQVAAGQPIAFVGSSGLSSDAHLHFSVFQNVTASAWKNGDVVETYLNPAAWWINAQPYAADVPGSLDHGISRYSPTTAELVERPAEHDVFYQSDGAGQRVWVWNNLHGIDAGDDLDFYFYRPGGAQFGSVVHFELPERHYGWWDMFNTLPTMAELGTWTIQARLNGSPLFSDSFMVVPQENWLGGVGNWNDRTRWQYDVPTQYAKVVIENGEALLHSGTVGEASELIIGGASPSSNGKVSLFTPAFSPNGGHLHTRDAFIGPSGQGSGQVVVGYRSDWTNGRDLFVGYQSSGTNTLDIQSGGDVFSGTGSIGDAAGAFGRVSIDAIGSTWTIASDLRVGNAGVGVLNVTNGGSVSNSRGWVGYHPNSSGTVVVDGTGSSWTNADYLYVGYGGQGRLTVSNGGAVFAVQVDISNQGTLLGNGNIYANPVFNDGDVRPGAPIGTLSIFGTFAQLSSGTLHIELQEGGHDKLVVSNGTLILDGNLDVTILGGIPFWTPGIGDSFDILDWQGNLISGTFDSYDLPSLPGGLAWDKSQLYTSGVISVQLAGDFNRDGRVDTADYIVWRKGLGTIYTQNDYNNWRAHFGQTAGSGSALPSAESLPPAVPEPASALLLLMGILAMRSRRGTTAS